MENQLIHTQIKMVERPKPTEIWNIVYIHTYIRIMKEILIEKKKIGMGIGIGIGTNGASAHLVLLD